jgi:predicted dehydrogenase
VLESGIDLVLLCTPPAFRPIHFLAAVEAGKHVFMEKPVAVCPEGVRMVLRGDEIARQKRLGVMPGTQYRWHPGYQGVIERIRAGHIGEIRAAYAYYNAASPAPRPREAGWSDMVYQLRNWLFYTWLSGDQPVEQFVHNIDVMNWVMGSVPVRAMAMGGRQARTAPEYGDVYDHFAIEYEYPNGVRVLAMCRQMDNTAYRVSNLVVGAEGQALMEQFTNFYVRGKAALGSQVSSG